jgi:hypothetical protein
MQFIVNGGQVHNTPLQFMAENGTVYDDLEFESKTIDADEEHKCYKSLPPR